MVLRRIGVVALLVLCGPTGALADPIITSVSERRVRVEGGGHVIVKVNASSNIDPASYRNYLCRVQVNFNGTWGVLLVENTQQAFKAKAGTPMTQSTAGPLPQ
jgi:hypothetical protein